MHEVAGSLWSIPTESQLSEALRLGAFGLRRLHWDTSDGRFASIGGFSVARAKGLSDAARLEAEAHLMVERPVDVVDEWAVFCDVIFVHVESENWQCALDRIVELGRTPGLAISPETAGSKVPRDIAVLCMSIVPGAAGSPFQSEVLRKITELRAASPERLIAVDGGIKRSHVEALVAAGANRIVVGTDLFSSGGEAKWADLLRSPETQSWS